MKAALDEGRGTTDDEDAAEAQQHWVQHECLQKDVVQQQKMKPLDKEWREDARDLMSGYHHQNPVEANREVK